MTSFIISIYLMIKNYDEIYAASSLIIMWCMSSMVTHTRNWCSAFNPSKCTHTAVSNEHAPRAVGSHCSSVRGAIGGSVLCSRTPQSWYWGWRERWLITLPTNNPCRTWDSNPQTLDYKSNSLNVIWGLPDTQNTSYRLS